VQQAATKLVSSLGNLSYEHRLQALRLTSLYDRRIRGYLIEMCKILNGFERIPSHQFFQLHSRSDCTRRHSMKLQVQWSRLDTRKYFYSQHVVHHWNGLPRSVVATSVNSFRRRMSRQQYKIWALKAPPNKPIDVKLIPNLSRWAVAARGRLCAMS